MRTLSYRERADITQNPSTKQLFQIMEEKQSNLCLSADVTTSSQLLSLAKQLGPHICLIKTHIDIIDDFSPQLTKELQMIARDHNFLIFEDRKFADIGTTCLKQYQGGIHRIADWTHFINAHLFVGPSPIMGLKQIGEPLGQGLILIAQMSVAGHHLGEKSMQIALEYAEEFAPFVTGFICREKISDNPSHLHLTPGVKIDPETDDMMQVYLTPQKVIGENESDIMIVGRGIYESSDPKSAAALYQEEGWNTYSNQLIVNSAL